MDSEHGVYVVTIVAFDSSMKDFLQANDVIIELNGKTVNNLDDLDRATQQADSAESLKMIIFRNQKENVIAIPTNSIKRNQ